MTTSLTAYKVETWDQPVSFGKYGKAAALICRECGYSVWGIDAPETLGRLLDAQETAHAQFDLHADTHP